MTELLELYRKKPHLYVSEDIPFTENFYPSVNGSNRLEGFSGAA